MRRFIVDQVVGLSLVDGGTPLPLRPDEVRLRMRAVSLNFRDHLILQGTYPLPVKADLVPVSDGAGEIAEIGSGVRDLAVGDRVVTAFFPDWQSGAICPSFVSRALGGSVDGVLAEEVVLPANAVLPFPSHLSFEQAATLPCAGVTAWNAVVEFGRLKPGDIVLLQGTGGVSTFALQFAKLAGAVVIQISSANEKLELARRQGADYLVNYSETPEWDIEARRITGGRGVDLVVEIGGAQTLERSIRATRLGGRIAGIGLVGGLGKIDPLPILTGVVQLSGILVGSHAMYRSMCDAISMSQMHPVIGTVFAFDDAPEAFVRLGEGSGTKIVIRT